MKCTKCGNELKDGAKFCAVCGNKITDSDNPGADRADNHAGDNKTTGQGRASGISGQSQASVKSRNMLIAAIIAVVLAVCVIVCVVVAASKKDNKPKDGSESKKADTAVVDDGAADGAADVAADTAIANGAAGSNDDASENANKQKQSDSDESQKAAGDASGEIAHMDYDDAYNAIEKLLNEFDDFRYAALVDYSDSLDNVGDKDELDLNAKNIMRAAGMGSTVRKGKTFTSADGEVGGIYLDANTLKKSAVNMFGRSADIDVLGDDWNYIYDVTLYDDMPVILWTEYETELESMVLDTDIKISAGKYQAVQDVYHGYWGLADKSESNFRLTYEFKEEPRSDYGMVISRILMERIADEWTHSGYSYEEFENEYPEEYDSYGTEAFYGIWCFASKNYEEAQKKCNEVVAAGLNGMMFYSAEWDNLNSEGYYLVSAGRYNNEADAKRNLDAVKSAGYGDAYVKFSGLHK